MKRKLIALVMVTVLLVITLSSCGSTTESDMAEENKTDITEEEDSQPVNTAEEETQTVRVEEVNGEEVLHITITFADNTTDDCIVLGTFELDGKEYIALRSENDSQKVYIYRYQEDSDDQWCILDIESKEERDAAYAEYDALMAEEED